MKIKLLNGDTWERNELLAKMSDDDFYYGYLGKNALSSSACKQLLKGKEGYVDSLMSNDDTKPNQAFREGGLFHLMALEPEKLSGLNVVDVKTKASRVYKDAVEEHGLVYTQKEWDKCWSWKESLDAVERANEIMEGCEHELPEIVDVDGIPFRVKGDLVKRGDYLADLKTTRDVSMFREASDTYGYDLQAYLYCKAFNVSKFIFIVIDKTTTEVQIFECSDQFMQSGKKKLDQAVANYKEWFGN
jgi:exonuclease VII small subunit